MPQVEPLSRLKPAQVVLLVTFRATATPPFAFVDICVYAVSVSTAVLSNVKGELCPRVNVGVVVLVHALPGAAFDTQNVSVSMTVAVIEMALDVESAKPP
jgi:hypothetical protein